MRNKNIARGGLAVAAVVAAAVAVAAYGATSSDPAPTRPLPATLPDPVAEAISILPPGIRPPAGVEQLNGREFVASQATAGRAVRVWHWTNESGRETVAVGGTSGSADVGQCSASRVVRVCYAVDGKEGILVGLADAGVAEIRVSAGGVQEVAAIADGVFIMAIGRLIGAGSLMVSVQDARGGDIKGAPLSEISSMIGEWPAR